LKGRSRGQLIKGRHRVATKRSKANSPYRHTFCVTELSYLRTEDCTGNQFGEEACSVGTSWLIKLSQFYGVTIDEFCFDDRIY
jgi:hypothetical protein